MSISTLVVRGTTGPLHRAILRLTLLWSVEEYRGLPEIFQVSGVGPGSNALTIVTDTKLCIYIRNELDRRRADQHDPIWRGRDNNPDLTSFSLGEVGHPW